jgi:hypothetical protein
MSTSAVRLHTASFLADFLVDLCFDVATAAVAAAKHCNVEQQL